jgi:hypothetical protein
MTKRLPGSTHQGWSHRMDDLSQWMADNGGTIRQAATALGISYDHTKHVWQRIRKRMGPQAC